MDDHRSIAVYETLPSCCSMAGSPATLASLRLLACSVSNQVVYDDGPVNAMVAYEHGSLLECEQHVCVGHQDLEHLLDRVIPGRRLPAAWLRCSQIAAGPHMTRRPA